MRFFRVLAVVCLGAAAAFGQFVFPGGGGSSFGPANPSAESSTAVASLTIDITSLSLTAATQNKLIVACYSGTGFASGHVTGPLTPVTPASPFLNPRTLTSVTANFTSASNVVCVANSSGGAGPAGANGATGAQGPIGPQGVQGPAGTFPQTQANTTAPVAPGAGQTSCWTDSVAKTLTCINDLGQVTHGVSSQDCSALPGHVSKINDDGSVECSADAGAVSTVFGRAGAVTAQSGDYAATQITNTPAGNIASTTVQAALSELDTEKAPVTSGSSVLKGNGSGGTTSAVFGTDLPGLASSNTFTGANDFSGVPSITPWKKGLFASLPATCVVGQSYFATDKTAGQNIYACTSTNLWTLEAGAGGGVPGGSPQSLQFNQSGSLAGVALNTAPQYQFVAQNGDGTNANAPGMRTIMAQHLGDMQVVRTSATVLTIGGNCTSTVPCWVGIGFKRVAIQASATITLVSGSHTPTAYIWVDNGGLIEAAYGGIGVTSGDVSCTGCGSAASFTSGFPTLGNAYSPISQWTASVAGSWDATGTQEATLYQSPYALLSGVFVVCTQGDTTASCDLDTSRLTDPSAPKIMSSQGMGLASAKPVSCSLGDLYFATDATPGQNLYFCTATNTWNQQTGGTTGAGVGYCKPASASGSAYTCTVSGISAYADGMLVAFRPDVANSSATPTVNIGGLGAKTITRQQGVAMQANDLLAGKQYALQYDSTSDTFQVIGLNFRIDSSGNVDIPSQITFLNGGSAGFFSGFTLGTLRLGFYAQDVKTCTAGAATLSGNNSSHYVNLNNQASCAITVPGGTTGMTFMQITMCNGATTPTTAITWSGSVDSGFVNGAGAFANSCYTQLALWDANSSKWRVPNTAGWN